MEDYDQQKAPQTETLNVTGSQPGCVFRIGYYGDSAAHLSNTKLTSLDLKP